MEYMIMKKINLFAIFALSLSSNLLFANTPESMAFASAEEQKAIEADAIPEKNEVRKEYHTLEIIKSKTGLKQCESILRSHLEGEEVVCTSAIYQGIIGKKPYWFISYRKAEETKIYSVTVYTTAPPPIGEGTLTGEK